jgi:hypothetical protein
VSRLRYCSLRKDLVCEGLYCTVCVARAASKVSGAVVVSAGDSVERKSTDLTLSAQHVRCPCTYTVSVELCLSSSKQRLTSRSSDLSDLSASTSATTLTASAELLSPYHLHCQCERCVTGASLMYNHARRRPLDILFILSTSFLWHVSQSVDGLLQIRPRRVLGRNRMCVL